MTMNEGAFITPDVATMKLGPLLVEPKGPQLEADPHVNLGPSPPHDDDADLTLEEIESLQQGRPPILGEQQTKPHYTEVLDPIWMEFDDPNERTASRLFAVTVQVGNAALKVHHLQMDLFDKVPFYKVVDEDRDRFRKEFNAYLKRIKHYKQALMGLPDDSVDTDEVYLGLIKRRQGAGPVPDVIMHLYFIDQLGVLEDHADEMGEGFVGRVMTNLERAGEISEQADEMLKDQAKELSEKAGAAIKRAFWIFTGAVVLTIGGIGTIAVVSRRRKDKT